MTHFPGFHNVFQGAFPILSECFSIPAIFIEISSLFPSSSIFVAQLQDNKLDLQLSSSDSQYWSWYYWDLTIFVSSSCRFHRWIPWVFHISVWLPDASFPWRSEPFPFYAAKSISSWLDHAFSSTSSSPHWNTLFLKRKGPFLLLIELINFAS